MITSLLWDVDGTLLDFSAAEKYGMEKCLREIGVDMTEEMLSVYSGINRMWWKKHEKGVATREEIFAGRLRDFFSRYGIDYTDYETFNRRYQESLGEAVFPMDDGIVLFARLKGSVKQYIVTNGSRRAQELKLAKSGLDHLADGIFISELVGYQKPKKEFFDAVQRSTGYQKENTMIIGDSLSSDMQGGNNAGILCCWYNPKGAEKPDGVHVDFEIRNLWELPSLLNKM